MDEKVMINCGDFQQPSIPAPCRGLSISDWRISVPAAPARAGEAGNTLAADYRILRCGIKTRGRDSKAENGVVGNPKADIEPDEGRFAKSLHQHGRA